VSITTRTTEEDMTPSYVVAVFSSRDKSHLLPPSGFSADHYILTRLSKVGDGNVLETLDEKIERVNEVPSIKQLGDGS
jgi:hypothetical protein